MLPEKLASNSLPLHHIGDAKEGGMLSMAISGTTRRIGKAQGYNGLCVRDFEYDDGTPAMMTAWQPTPTEIEKIVAGEPVYLTILGSAHPPVLLQVGLT